MVPLVNYLQMVRVLVREEVKSAVMASTKKLLAGDDCRMSEGQERIPISQLS